MLNEPVVCKIMPVTIGPTTPPILETEFWSPATTEVIFLGATSPGSAHTWEAATVVPDFAIHKSTMAVTADSAKAARPMQDAIRRPPTKKTFRVALKDSHPFEYTLSDAQPAATSTTIEIKRGNMAAKPIASIPMPFSLTRYVGSHVIKK